MGHGSSKPDPSDGAEKSYEKQKSRFSTKYSFRRRIRTKLRCRHKSDPNSSSTSDHPPPHRPRLVTAEDFAGIALVTIKEAKMQFKDRWFACISLGERTYRTSTSDNTDNPRWNSEKKLLLETNGPRFARVTVYETNRVLKNKLIGYCEVDLFQALTLDSDSEDSEINDCILSCDLFDPLSDAVVGTVSLSFSVEDPADTEKWFARRILSIVDYNQDGRLQFGEFSALIDAFGNQVAAKKKKELFEAADKDKDETVSMEELANLLAIQQQKDSLISSCPVCGETLGISDTLNEIIHLTLCLDEGTGNQAMTGAFLTDKQASYGWIFKLSEWVHFSSYEIGLRSGSSASHILVYDRKAKRVVEEVIAGKVNLSMRAIYQSKIGLSLIDKGAKNLLRDLSVKQGLWMNSLESVADIQKFIESYQGQINMNEVKLPIKDFKTFNEFFIRELKPGARPVVSEREEVAVCAADCRLTAFESIEHSKRFWVKGQKFSIHGLLGKKEPSPEFSGGSLVIFRLAPQDYHRFHAPVSGTIEKIEKIPGSLYTVNPIAVSSKYCNVFTENKREVMIISTNNFGKVAFVAIGATMVGSITFTKKEGDFVQKGEELGHFSFGGSTVICVFENNTIKMDEDLLGNSRRSLETLVCVGMSLGSGVVGGGKKPEKDQTSSKHVEIVKEKKTSSCMRS